MEENLEWARTSPNKYSLWERRETICLTDQNEDNKEKTFRENCSVSSQNEPGLWNQHTVHEIEHLQAWACY